MSSVTLKVSSILRVFVLLLCYVCDEVFSAAFTDLSRTAHYTPTGKLVERWFDLTGRLAGCHVYGDRRESEAAIELISHEHQFMINEDNFQRLISDCPVSPVHHRVSRHVIYPGTKWCGVGTIASGPDDLGVQNVTDSCCRDHDTCPVSIDTGKTKYNITNRQMVAVPIFWGSSTTTTTEMASQYISASILLTRERTSCQCDRAFYNCLKAANNSASKTVGMIFFNLVKAKCLEKAFPETCTGIWFWRKCTKDHTQEKRLRLVQPHFTF